LIATNGVNKRRENRKVCNTKMVAELLVLLMRLRSGMCVRWWLLICILRRRGDEFLLATAAGRGDGLFRVVLTAAVVLVAIATAAGCGDFVYKTFCSPVTDEDDDAFCFFGSGSRLASLLTFSLSCNGRLLSREDSGVADLFSFSSTILSSFDDLRLRSAFTPFSFSLSFFSSTSRLSAAAAF
jgi:hypothetical protein